MAQSNEGSKVVYDHLEAQIHAEGGTHPPIDAEKAKAILGWKEEGKGGSNVKYGKSETLLTYKDQDGKVVKVRCDNNRKNRPLYNNNVMAIKQEILRGRWQMNGEPIIIGRHGTVLNGQHQLSALILATIEWQADKEAYPHWTSPPTICKCVNVGISEAIEVINTMDTCKPRSLADVIFLSPYFADFDKDRRRKAAAYTDRAVKFLWDRIGENADGQVGSRNHSESVDFIERHRRVLECVEFIMDEGYDELEANQQIVPPGMLAGLLYLFGAAKTNPKDYFNHESLVETNINWSKWDTAEEFIVKLIHSGEEFYTLRQIRAKLIEQQEDYTNVRRDILVKAWNLYLAGEKITQANIKLRYETGEDGIPVLAEHPIVGGVDIGSLTLISEDFWDKAAPSIVGAKRETKQQEILDKKKERGELKPSQVNPPTKTKIKPVKTKDKKPLLATEKWVYDSKGNHWRGKIVDVISSKQVRAKVLTGFQGAGNDRIVATENLRDAQPV